jgi:hypothetical protein
LVDDENESQVQTRVQQVCGRSLFGPPIWMMMMTAGTFLWLLLTSLLLQPAIGLNIIVAGGTGRLGRILIPKLLLVEPSPSFTTAVTVLTRNAFLASTPTRVSEDYGHLGKGFIEKYQKKLRLRDWDGGDLLDIVGQDWVGWQRDTLPKADVILHLTGGGYTEQRVMACERLVRESIKHKSLAHHITINPSVELLTAMSPGLKSVVSIGARPWCDRIVNITPVCGSNNRTSTRPVKLYWMRWQLFLVARKKT